MFDVMVNHEKVCSDLEKTLANLFTRIHHPLTQEFLNVLEQTEHTKFFVLGVSCIM